MKYFWLVFVAVALSICLDIWYIPLIGIAIAVVWIVGDAREQARCDELQRRHMELDADAAEDTSLAVTEDCEEDYGEDFDYHVPTYEEGRKRYKALLIRRNRWLARYKEYYDSLSVFSRGGAESYDMYVLDRYWHEEVSLIDDLYKGHYEVDEIDFVRDEIGLYSEELEEYGLDYYSMDDYDYEYPFYDDDDLDDDDDYFDDERDDDDYFFNDEFYKDEEDERD